MDMLADKTRKLRKALSTTDPTELAIGASLLTGTCLLVRYAYLKLSQKYNNYPPGPMSTLPIISSTMNALNFLKSPFGSLDALGGIDKISSIDLGFNTNVFINDIETVHKVMANKNIGRFRPPIANMPYYSHFLVLNGKQWNKRRKYFTANLVGKICNAEYIYKQIYNAIEDNLVETMDNIADGSGVSGGGDGLWYPSKYASFIDFNLMFDSLFGVNLSINDEFVNKYLSFPQKWFESVTNVFILAACVKFNIGKYIYNKFTQNHNQLELDHQNILISWMKEKGGFDVDLEKNHIARRSRMNDDNGKKSYIDFLINEIELSATQILHDIQVLLITGTNTTSKAIEYGVLLLAQNEKIQEDVYNEIIKICGVKKGFDLEKLSDMHLLRAFIHEVLRLSVVSPLAMPHYAKKNVTVNDIDGNGNGDGGDSGRKIVIPKGAIVHTNSHYIHRYGGKNEGKIDLNNWLENYKESKMFHFDEKRLVIFGSGARACPGMPIAMKILYCAFGILMLKYKFKNGSKGKGNENIKQSFAWVPVIDPPIGVALEKRD